MVAARGGFALVTPAAGDGPEAWFAGSLASLTVPEVIQFIFTTIKSGTLTLSFGADARRVAESGGGARPHRRTLYFREGQVVFAASSDLADRLGSVLWRQGLVERAELDRCGKLIRTGRPLGQVLVDEEILTSGQLYEAITIQVKEIVLASCLEQEGEFAFVEGPFDESNAVKLDERTRDLLLQGMKRIEEVEQLAARVGGRGSVLVRGAADADGIEGPEGRLIEEADGHRTLCELASTSGLGLYETLRLAAPLVDAGALAIGEAEPPAPAGSPGEEEAGVDVAIDVEPPAPPAKAPSGTGPFETYRRIFRHVHASLAKHQPDALSRLNSYFDRLPARQRQLFEGVRLDEDGDMDVSIVVMNASASGARAPMAKAKALEALENFLAFSLFEVKNRMPKPAAEALLREVGRMQVGKA
ncbi:MAG: DUF4388 domain-containing protein [Anaeromyxobacteraceae bacterium]